MNTGSSQGLRSDILLLARSLGDPAASVLEDQPLHELHRSGRRCSGLALLRHSSLPTSLLVVTDEGRGQLSVAHEHPHDL